MEKMKKTENQASKNPGDVTPSESQKDQGRPDAERRIRETPRRNEEQQQGQGNRFPRESFEGGRKDRPGAVH